MGDGFQRQGTSLLGLVALHVFCVQPARIGTSLWLLIETSQILFGGRRPVVQKAVAREVGSE